MQNNIQEAYVQLSADETILTFYFDTLRAERDGTTWGIGETKEDSFSKYYAWTGTFESPNTSVLTAVFDASFREFRPTSTEGWFYSLESLTNIKGFEHLNTSQVTDMSGMFLGCSSLTEIDLSHFDTSQVTTMYKMFVACSSLTEIDLSGFDISQVEIICDMFCGCHSLTTIYSNATWNCDDSEDMFAGCTSLCGAVPYDDSKTDASMANPETGYFTVRR